ncbi:alpha/beta hydrolase [Rubellicoccus peritrichatus]|uniref:Alpha/beta hydrolase n=1 Tax=Rubellicoccus peritrichatus TaxID=3080537 RepID=A0AAQ3LEZ9_9BACT|nr:alpha/beta hydrolase [Puniceicoccus sp. CR14]WOO43344.1 alpha/beta hydrolase [Puniceicoccus sp. CR14]
MANSTAKSKYFETSDGARLHYLEAGSGPPLVMIPGWSQTAEQYKFQIEALSDRWRCIAIDMRGHGESDKVNYGYRIQRLSQDVREFLVGLDLENVALLGHSLGCGVLWGYWDLYQSDRLSKLILVDQAPCMTLNPEWDEKTIEAAGAQSDAAKVMDCANLFRHADAEAASADMLNNMFTTNMPEAQRAWIIERNLLFPREHAATLIYNNQVMDWRDVIPRINIPTLVFSGKASTVPWKSQVWVHEQIANSELVLFEENEGGSHFMFIEGKEKFNQALAKFLAS